MENSEDILLRAKEIAERGDDPDEALRLCNQVLNKEPDNHVAMFLAGYVLMKAEKIGLAYNLFKRCQSLIGDDPRLMNNMGMCAEDFDVNLALSCFAKALTKEPDDPTALSNQALMLMKLGKFEKAEKMARQALKNDPDFRPAHDNLGLALLAQRNWEEGWKEYQYGYGNKFRKRMDYGVPEWDGVMPGHVIVHGEQGIGDEIMFSSCIPDALKHATNITIDCDHRLESLFSRSFDCDVSGTRYRGNITLKSKPDFQCSIADLPRFYRNKHADFPREPYLTPDPERCTQWRALLDQHEGLKIGIAWSGGTERTNESRRSIDLDTFAPLFETNNTFVSLEYKKPDQDKLDQYGILHWDRAVLKGVDYDETLALIHELDLVISVCTTAIYGAGSVGRECWCLVPEIPSYRYHVSGDLPWFKSVKSFRQNGEWSDLIEQIKIKLEKFDAAS